MIAALVTAFSIGSCGFGEPIAICSDGLDGQSVARRWNEQVLDAIRRDTPAPTVHARNLLHSSTAMWDAWAAYDDAVNAAYIDRTIGGNDDDRAVTISWAAHTVLTARYRNAVGGAESLSAFDEELRTQCLDPQDASGPPAALGVDIGEATIERFVDDGALELDGYLDLGYVPANRPLVVAEPGTDADDPDRWQPLQLEESVTQNEQSQIVPLQSYIGPHWGFVEPFAMDQSDDGLPVAIEALPTVADDLTTVAEQVLDVLRFQRRLDDRVNSTIDAGPASIGNNSIGTNDGTGHAQNPTTGLPYEPNPMTEADFGRVIAEFWADGPSSETPPGHWNTVANEVADHPELDLRFGGTGEPLSRLEWDLRMYLTLNGAMHDSAIAAWGAKRTFDSSRPITLIRWMAGRGQSSDPNLPAFDPQGLPLESDIVEVVTDETAGDRHSGFTPGTVVARAWAGHETLHDDADEIRWIDATTWVPYQLDTFVTPSFPGYVSGHSTFSRAGAEVLTAITGSPYFPGGLGTWTAPAGWLRFDDGPETDVQLQWATYQDAADQAGVSRIHGGIHIAADDTVGRSLGATVAESAIDKAFAIVGATADR